MVAHVPLRQEVIRRAVQVLVLRHRAAIHPVEVVLAPLQEEDVLQEEDGDKELKTYFIY